MFVGRIFQAVGGTSAWIIGLATLRDSIEAKDMGKAFGLVHGCVSIGALSGPAVAGLLLALTSYWITWMFALVVLAVDIAMRLAMVNPKAEAATDQSSAQEDSSAIDDEATYGQLSTHDSVGIPSGQDEQQALIREDQHERLYGTDMDTPAEERTQPDEKGRWVFYKIMLSQRRVLIGLSCSVVYSAMLASYSTTIPTHVKSAFGWGSLETGLLFVGLQGPSFVISPLCGWLRDKIGTRLPATIGFALLAPCLWLLGAADHKPLPWAADEEHSKRVYITAVIGIGFVMNLMASIGTIEMTCKCFLTYFICGQQSVQPAEKPHRCGR